MGLKARETHNSTWRANFIWRSRQQLLHACKSCPEPCHFEMANLAIKAIVEMTRQLRDRKYRNGLILANGGLLTHHHAICLSSQPRKDCIIYPPQPLLLMPSQFPPAPLVDEEAEGDVSIEVSLSRSEKSSVLTSPF